MENRSAVFFQKTINGSLSLSLSLSLCVREEIRGEGMMGGNWEGDRGAAKSGECMRVVGLGGRRIGAVTVVCGCGRRCCICGWGLNRDM